MTWVYASLLMLSCYAAAGVPVGLWFVLRGASRIDPAAAGAPWGFRILIFPASCALWPIVLRWGVSRSSANEERGR